MNKAYLWSKKIHRWAMWLMMFFGGLMTVTGVTLKYWGGLTDFGDNFKIVRQWHRDVSVWFVAVMGIMAVTGVIMYVYPMIIRRKRSL